PAAQEVEEHHSVALLGEVRERTQVVVRRAGSPMQPEHDASLRLTEGTIEEAEAEDLCVPLCLFRHRDNLPAPGRRSFTDSRSLRHRSLEGSVLWASAAADVLACCA